MSRSLLFGIDPGFASVGWAVVSLHRGEGETVLGLGVIRTEPAKFKHKVLVAEDNVVRTSSIVKSLRAILTDPVGLPVGAGADFRAICAESMSHTRNASAASKVALTWGVIVTLSDMLRLPLLQESPQKVKKALCASGDASKKEVQDALCARYSIQADASARYLRDIPKGQHEHAWDALASVVACLNSDVVRMARQMVS
jgi:Holliday junction resolvasome RuvABC endonuclease subunit